MKVNIWLLSFCTGPVFPQLYPTFNVPFPTYLPSSKVRKPVAGELIAPTFHSDNSFKMEFWERAETYESTRMWYGKGVSPLLSSFSNKAKSSLGSEDKLGKGVCSGCLLKVYSMLSPWNEWSRNGIRSN